MVFVYHYSCNLTLQWEKMVIADISNINTSISKIIDLIRPLDEWAEIAFSGCQNAENEHCQKLKKLVHKLNFHHWTCSYMTLNVVFVYYYSSNLSLEWESCGFCRYFFSQHNYIQNHWLNKTRWRMSRIRIFSSAKCWKWTLKNTQEIVH